MNLETKTGYTVFVTIRIQLAYILKFFELAFLHFRHPCLERTYINNLAIDLTNFVCFAHVQLYIPLHTFFQNKGQLVEIEQCC